MKKKILVSIIILNITIWILILFVILYKNKLHEKEIISFNITNSLSDRNIVSEQKEENKVEGIILYNTIYVPLDESFTKIFGEKYKIKTSQNIKLENMDLQINLENKEIVIPNEYVSSKINQHIDDTINVEIENINGENYIPVYLISNLPKILVKINGKSIYTSTRYLSSIDAYKENENNEIIIYSLDKDIKNKGNIYSGENDGALWREEALKRIEKYRKNNKKINIKNQNGDFINSATLKIKMKNNEFNFGTAVKYENEKSDYTDISKKYFNTIGSENLFKWKAIEISGIEPATEFYNYAISNDYYLRGHNLWWDYVYSKELKEKIVGNIDNLEPGTMYYVYQKYSNGDINADEAEKESKQIEEKFKQIVYKHIEDEVKKFSKVNEWDVVNEGLVFQYFKYYLFDREYLTDNKFITDEYKSYSSIKKYTYYKDNESYYKFIAKCYDIAKENNPNAKLIYNDNILTGDAKNLPATYTANIIKNIMKYTNKLDVYGVEYHARYFDWSPQSYYNQINKELNLIAMNEATITEYTSPSLRTNNKATNKDRANYLRDSLIGCYSNPKIKGFTMWVYNGNNFSDEERDEYKETVYPWLNYTDDEAVHDGTYSTRLYKGTYEATVTLDNGKNKTIEFNVSDDSPENVEIVIDADITGATLKKQPSKTTYYRGDTLDLTDGVIELSYDDGTIQELNLIDLNCNITGFDGNKLGTQLVNIKYQNYNFTYQVNVEENVNDKIAVAINNIKQKNEDIYNSNKIFSQNKKLQENYKYIISKLSAISENISKNSVASINEVYQSEFVLISSIIDGVNDNTIVLSSSDEQSLINSILNIKESYACLYQYYVTNDTIDDDDIEAKLNNSINKYNDNTDVEADLSVEMNLLSIASNIYKENISEETQYVNYLNKQEISNICEIVDKSLNNIIKVQADKEYSKITYTSNVETNKFTNEDEVITINLPTNKVKILNNDGKNTITFNENGTKLIKFNIRGYDYDYTITINNIDKIFPILNVEKEGTSIKPAISDDNLEKISIMKDGKEVQYNNGDTISESGIYTITVTDKAGNTSTEKSIIYGTYNDEQNKTTKYISVNSETTISTITADTDYLVTKDGQTKSNDSNIATGDKIEILGKTYDLIVKGDITGSGKADIMSLVQIRKNIVGLKDFTKIQRIAGDLNNNNRIDIADLVRERKLIIGAE